MKRIFIFLLLLLSLDSFATIAIVASNNTQFAAPASATSASMNSTGATLIVIMCTYRTAQSYPTITDSKSNIWTRINNYDGGSGNVSGVAAYYCSNPIVGTGHTFTETGANYGAISVFACSGTRTASTPLDQQNGQYIATLGATATPGSITPSANNCIVFSGVMNYNGSAPTMPSGYTAGFTWTTSTAYAGGAGYQIQTTATATNPSWGNMNAGANGAVNIVSFFEPASAVAPPKGGFFYNMLN